MRETLISSDKKIKVVAYKWISKEYINLGTWVHTKTFSRGLANWDIYFNNNNSLIFSAKCGGGYYKED